MHSTTPREPVAWPVLQRKAIPRMSRRVSRGGTVGPRFLPSPFGGQKICCRGQKGALG